MARKTSSRRSNKVPKRPCNEKKRREKEYGDTFTTATKDFKDHEPDCQCHLRKGISEGIL
jgi:hypothetical protein